jgi:exosortase A
MTALAWTPARTREVWRLPLAITALLAVILLLLYRGTAMAMVEIWIRSETYTHAFVVPPIVAWLIWRKRGEVAPLCPQPLPWAVLPMAGAALLWWLGQLVNVAAAMQLALVVMLVACVPLVLGWRVTRTLAFPLAFLFFAVPIGEFLTPTLMHWTAEALVGALRLTGIPVYQEGQQLVIPSGRWAVVEACSGIRYLMATFMVGSLFAYLNYQSTGKRLAFVVISLVMPVVANWVRAYIIVMLGHLSDNKIATGVDHLVYGWAFFGVVILALFFIGARWADYDRADEATAVAVRQARARAETAAPAWRGLAIAAVALLVAAGPVLHAQQSAGVVPAAPVRLELPATLGAWRAVPAQEGAWAPHFPEATRHVARDYQGPTGTVAVHLTYYRGQDADAKLVSSINGFTAAETWHILSDGKVSTMVDGQSIDWRRARLTTSYGRLGAEKPHLTVWRLYWLGGPVAQGDIMAKLLQAWQGVRGEPDDGAAIHLVSSLPDEAAARQQLAAFANEHFAMLQRVLVAAKESR